MGSPGFAVRVSLSLQVFRTLLKCFLQKLARSFSVTKSFQGFFPHVSPFAPIVYWQPVFGWVLGFWCGGVFSGFAGGLRGCLGFGLVGSWWTGWTPVVSGGAVWFVGSIVLRVCGRGGGCSGVCSRWCSLGCGRRLLGLLGLVLPAKCRCGAFWGGRGGWVSVSFGLFVGWVAAGAVGFG